MLDRNHVDRAKAVASSALGRLLDILLARALSKIVTRGFLRVTSNGGRAMTFGDGTGPAVSIHFKDNGAKWHFLTDADLKLGELYMEGRFLVKEGSLYDFVALILREAQYRRFPLVARMLDAARTYLRVFRMRNFPARSRQNVAHHYDLDGRLYSLFLDADRQYSCAYFENETASLDEAQQAKKRHLLRKLHLQPDSRILDIGCGWGGLAVELSRHARAGSVLGITLSTEQLTYAQGRPKAHPGEAGSVEFLLQDYRSLSGQFDRIVSVGMFEHVGRRSYRTFFEKCAGLLDQSGVMVLHTIGCSGTPGFTTPWLDKYIFPGGYIPALSEIIPEIEAAGLVVSDIEVLRLHYAMTLSHWRQRFIQRRAEAVDLYDERFCLMWEYYLSTAEAAFRYEDLVVFQIQIAKRNDVLPLTRGYIDGMPK